jgi:AcrR family transcriptional regulator
MPDDTARSTRQQASIQQADPRRAGSQTGGGRVGPHPEGGGAGLHQANTRETGTRQGNRRQDLLDAAARLFARQGFHAASMRDIARAVGMLPGSLYYHFTSKDELLLAVYGEGVRRIAERVDAAVARAQTPWARLEAACAAHAEMLLDGAGDYAQVVIRVRPQDCAAMEARLTALRDAHEDRFKALFAALELPAGTDRRALRLMLLGALNWSQTWYRPGGDSPGAIARHFLALLRCGADGEAAP